jgi:carboxyl-terminal processing protease
MRKINKKQMLLQFMVMLCILIISCNDSNPVSPTISLNDQIYSFASQNLQNYFIYREKLPLNFTNYPGPINLYRSVNDRWTVFYLHNDANEYRKTMTTLVVGLGVRVDSAASGVVVMHITPNSSAASSGLLIGDTILSVGSNSVVNVPITTVKSYLRGNDGAELLLSVKRGSESLKISATLRPYLAETVYSEQIDSSTAYIQLLSFTGTTISDSGSRVELRNALQKFPAIKNLILDLRGNGGGLISQCESIAGFFLPSQSRLVSTYIRDSSGGVYFTKKSWYESDGDGAYGAIKLYVLTDSNSASASEMLISGLQSNSSNVVTIGDTTYGKACGQRIFDGPDSCLAKITIMKIYRNDGTTYHSTGIAPDIYVEPGSARKTAENLIKGVLAKTSRSSDPWRTRCIDCPEQVIGELIE